MSNAKPGLTSEDLISNRALAGEDADDFGYSAIAGRVSETILGLDPPLTLGLFGPWGSGKSSFCELLRRDLAKRDSTVRLVRYDASTYGGEALRRNFISHIATQLGYGPKRHSDFHRGLYESRRTTGLDFEAVRDSFWSALGWLAVVMVGFLFVSCLLVGISSIGTKEDFFGQISKTLPDLLAPSAIGGLIIAVAGLLLKGASIEAEQSQPASDEAFAETFKELVNRSRDDKKFERLVVFVDELDRCSSDDVVATLTAIRTFLNQDHAVFVVAADRAALERALEEKLPQPTPVDLENPYYSSASSFFDKIFHDRVPLPPLRGPRLSQWAFDKVKNRKGYWGELRESDERALRRVLFFLIPSHVTSPRRVKVLLNGFVRSAAIAAHSGFDWIERANEIAKLTAIDVEYPSLGADLRLEPRLPGFLLKPPPNPSKRVKTLLEKHGGSQISRGPSEEEADIPQGAEPADPILPDVDEDEARALTEAEHEQLRRYLARTREISIRRDLLFLDPAGAAFGIDDPELGALLDQAVDVPAEVVTALADYDPETRRPAVRVLADMVEREFGEERINAMTALSGAVELLDDLDGIADELAGNLESYLRDEDLSNGQLRSALRIALAAHGYRRLRDSILSDSRLVANPEVLVETATLLPEIPADQREPIQQALADSVESGGVELVSVLKSLPTEIGAELISSEPVYSAVFRYIGPEAGTPGEHDELAESIFVLAEEREDDGLALAQAMYELLVKEEIGYGALAGYADKVLEGLSEEARDLELLKILHLFPGNDTDHWASQLSPGKYSSTEHGETAVPIATAMVEGATFTNSDEVDALLKTLSSLVPFMEMASTEDREVLSTALETRLNEYSWWESDDSCARQEAAHKVGHHLSETGSEFSAAIDSLLAKDLVRAPLGPGGITATTACGLSTMGSELASSAASVLELLPTAEDEGNPAPIWTSRARVALARAEKDAGMSVDSSVVSTSSMVEAAEANSEHGNEGVADWLRLIPGSEDVIGVLRALDGRRTPQITEAFEAWCDETSENERTNLGRQLLGAESWETGALETVVAHGVDETKLIEGIAMAIRDEPRGPRREELMATVGRIAPVDPAAQKEVADLIVELASSDKQVDFKAAVKAIPGLGTEHRSAGRLREAFQQAAEKRGFKLSERAAKQLAEAKVKVAKKSVKKGVWGQVRDLFR